MNPRLTRGMYWTLVGVLVACNLLVAWYSLTQHRLWEDEAFNLTVPLNLLAGHGYTSDGALSGSTLTPFDTRISTGPVVLLPVAAVLSLGIDPVIGARIIPLLFWAALIAGLAVLGRRMAGRWGALLAAAVPLCFNGGGPGGISPIQGPADLLGEIPAAALIVWALVALPRRAWLAGLLVGLAIEAKIIAVLALPAFAVALWALAHDTGWRRIGETLRRGWLPLVLAGVPMLLYEIWVFIALGIDGYIQHLRDFLWFLRSGGQSYEPTTVWQKLGTLLGAWFVPWWMALIVAVAVAALIGAALLIYRHRRSTIPPQALAYLLAAITGSAAFIGWWATASHLPLWVRHPAPGIYAFLPLFAALALSAVAVLRSPVWGISALAGGMLGNERLRTGIATALTAVLAIGVASSITVRVSETFDPGWETLPGQRASMEPLREWVAETDTEWLAAQPWGAAISAALLSGAHVGLFDADAMDGVPRITGGECETEVLAEGPVYRICAAP